MTISPAFTLLQLVYLKTDVEQLPRLVVSYVVYPDLSICYKLACGTATTEHFDVEISEEKNLLL